MTPLLLRNTGPVDDIVPMKTTLGWPLNTLYFPRLQVNKRGEIILATFKHGSLTTGILVGKTPESKSTLSIGTQCTDWEVAGPLVDYDGDVQLTIRNRVPHEAFPEITGRGHGGLVTQRRELNYKEESTGKKLTAKEKATIKKLTVEIDKLSEERDAIVLRFENREHLPGDKERLAEINKELY